MEFPSPVSFFKGSRKKNAPKDNPRSSNEAIKPIEKRRTEGRPAETPVDSGTMFKSLPWLRSSDNSSRSSSPSRFREDGRQSSLEHGRQSSLEKRHAKPRAPPQQPPQPRMVARPTISIPIEPRYEAAYSKKDSQSAVPVRYRPDVGWPLPNFELKLETTVSQDDTQDSLHSSKTSRVSISPVSPCSSYDGDSMSISTVSPVSPLEQSLFPPPPPHQSRPSSRQSHPSPQQPRPAPQQFRPPPQQSRSSPQKTRPTLQQHHSSPQVHVQPSPQQHRPSPQLPRPPAQPSHSRSSTQQSRPSPTIPLSRSFTSPQVARPLVDSEKSSITSATYSSPSDGASTISSRPVVQSLREAPSKQFHSPVKASRTSPDVVFWKELAIPGKRKGLNKVKAMDVSNSGAVVAIKHADYSLRFWNIGRGAVQSTISVPSYIDAGKRAKESFELGHIIISDVANLAAIITNFGRTLEIWNWSKGKKLQTLDDQVDRWAAERFDLYSSVWSPLAIYKARPSLIELYAPAPTKKPYAKVRTINLRHAEFPYVPQRLELGIIPGRHMLVAAVGPMAPKPGQPPPDREIMLAAWDVSDYREVRHTPRHFVRPLHHVEIDLESPISIIGHRNTVISIWVPPSHRAERQTDPRTGATEWKLASVSSSFRHVLVWDLSGNVTHVYQVPNTVTCISSDCRLAAYSLTAQGQSRIVIVDARSGAELQSIQHPNNGSVVTELAYSPDGRLLLVGDSEGNTNVFEVGVRA